MSPKCVLVLALLCASASADTRTTQNYYKTVDSKELHDLKSDILLNVSYQKDENEFCASDVGCNVGVQKSLDEIVLNEDIIYTLTDEEYYRMPQLFDLDEYKGCLALQGAYCLGSFELSPIAHNPVFTIMKRYSANWVDNFNHTRLHRGICLQRTCRPPDQYNSIGLPTLDAWFEACVNDSTMVGYNLSARLYKLDYCTQGPEKSDPVTTSERAFAGFVAILCVFAVISTVLDMTLEDLTKKGYGWALSWSVRSSWQALTAPHPTSCGSNLKVFDVVRIACILCILVEHVCWLGAITYVADTRYMEQTRRSPDIVLLTNSTLVLQIFFLMTSFLLAHKLLQQKQHQPAVSTFRKTLLQRIVRIIPSYLVVLWFIASWWERLGAGPNWKPLVRSEASGCRQNWWRHLLYVNNLHHPDDLCLPHTWYLATDMQLYVLMLALTLTLRRCRIALPILGMLFLVVTAILLVLSYAFHLVPTCVVHQPEAVRATYRDDLSFAILYMSPLSNATGALAGLLLAHLHHALNESSLHIREYKKFRWVSVAAAPAALWWVASSPAVLAVGPPARFPAAALAAFERPVFILLIAIALLGAINKIESTSSQETWLSRGTTVVARLSYGVFLVHMTINKTLLANRMSLSQVDRLNGVFEWLAVVLVSHAAAIPLALLVELPTQRLYKELTAILRKKYNKFDILDKDR